MNIPFTDELEATEKGLVINGKPDFHTWYALWLWLKERDKAMPWIIGDMLTYGEIAYGEMASQAYEPDSEQAHFTIGTLRQYKFVASQWPLSSRLDELPWSYHQTTAHLPMDQRLAMMHHCIEHDIKRAELRLLVREVNNGKSPNPPTNPDDTIDQLTQDNYQKDKRIVELESRLKNAPRRQIEESETDSDDLPTYVSNAIDSLKNWLKVDSAAYEYVTVFANGNVMWKARE